MILFKRVYFIKKSITFNDIYLCYSLVFVILLSIKRVIMSKNFHNMFWLTDSAFPNRKDQTKRWQVRKNYIWASNICNPWRSRWWEDMHSYLQIIWHNWIQVDKKRKNVYTYKILHQNRERENRVDSILYNIYSYINQ